MDSKFLGKDGLTQTSANHLANIAKEMYEALEAKLESLKLVSRDFVLAAVGTSFKIDAESPKEELGELEGTLREIASLKALIAWLREGIKAKEELSESSSERTYIQTLIKQGRKDLELKDLGSIPTFQKVLASRSASEQARYYALEARCATLGKYIHPDGYFAEERKAYYKRLKNPTVVKGTGQDAEIHSFSSSFTPAEIDNVFFALQKKYRALQAEFNALKAQIEQESNELEKEYLREMNEDAERVNRLTQIETLAYRESVRALKIIIPESLREIYEKVNVTASQK